MANGVLFLAAFFLMEPVTSLLHRCVFHGFGYAIHRSHHRTVRAPGREAMDRDFLEWNDFYPLFSAVITMAVIAAGVFFPPAAFLIPVGFGMTLYGAAYFFIHDMVVHSRFRFLKIDRARFRWHYEAHVLHHRFGGEPYGFVFPVVPKRLKPFLNLPDPK
jgi:beta-carotene 3-hydroxylase